MQYNIEIPIAEWESEANDGHCPNCGHYEVKHVWYGKGRTLRYECRECQSHSPAHTPSVEPITTTRRIATGYHGGWEYTLYDQYGHAAVHSRTYGTEKEMVEVAKDDLARHNMLEGYAPCTVVYFPKSVEVQGIVLK